MDVKRNHCSVGVLGVLTSSVVFVVIFVESSSAMPMWEKITTIPDVRWVSVILFIIHLYSVQYFYPLFAVRTVIESSLSCVHCFFWVATRFTKFYYFCINLVFRA